MISPVGRSSLPYKAGLFSFPLTTVLYQYNSHKISFSSLLLSIINTVKQLAVKKIIIIIMKRK